MDSLLPPSGGDWGVLHVDNCFKSYLSLLFGNESVSDFMQQNVAEWFKLIKNYEFAKLSTESLKTGQLGLHIPLGLLTSAAEKKGLRGVYELAELMKAPNFGGHFGLIGEILEIDEEAIEGMYTYTTNSVIGKLEQLLKMGVVCNKHFDHVIITGGLANSKIVRHALENELKRHSLVFQEGSELFAVKGAVLYGYKRTIIRSRVMPLTYGIKSTVPFDESKHKGAEISTINNVKMCTDSFHLLIKAGTTVKPGHEVKEFDKPLRADDKEQRFEIYSCGAADDIPSLTSHCSMQKEASFSVPLPHGCLVEDKTFERCVVFGDTDISFKISFQKGKRHVYTKNMTYS